VAKKSVKHTKNRKPDKLAFYYAHICIVNEKQKNIIRIKGVL